MAIFYSCLCEQLLWYHCYILGRSSGLGDAGSQRSSLHKGASEPSIEEGKGCVRLLAFSHTILSVVTHYQMYGN